jgi:hypothetical protein
MAGSADGKRTARLEIRDPEDDVPDHGQLRWTLFDRLLTALDETGSDAGS